MRVARDGATGDEVAGVGRGGVAGDGRKRADVRLRGGERVYVLMGERTHETRGKYRC